MTDQPVLVVGEALVDIVHRRDGSVDEHVGGSPLNVAVGLARLGHPVELATQIGRDERGQRIGEHLAADGIALVPGSEAADRTSTATAELDDAGGARYTFDLTDVSPPAGEGSGHLHTGSIGALLGEPGQDVLAAMTRAQQQVTVSYDPNARPSLMGEPGAALAAMEQRIAVSDVVKASDEDMAWLLDRDLDGFVAEDAIEVLRRWVDLGASLAVATLGPDGAVAVHASGEVRVPGRAVEVADTVGAGDSFTSGLLSALLDAGLLGDRAAAQRLAEADAADITAAVARGVVASAVTVSRPGAQPPTRADLGLT